MKKATNNKKKKVSKKRDYTPQKEAVRKLEIYLEKNNNK